MTLLMESAISNHLSEPVLTSLEFVGRFVLASDTADLREDVFVHGLIVFDVRRESPCFPGFKEVFDFAVFGVKPGGAFFISGDAQLNFPAGKFLLLFFQGFDGFPAGEGFFMPFLVFPDALFRALIRYGFNVQASFPDLCSVFLIKPHFIGTLCIELVGLCLDVDFPGNLGNGAGIVFPAAFE